MPPRNNMVQNVAAPAPDPTMDAAPWPLALCRAPLGDAALAEAYEHSTPEHRACIKQCLALLHALWGETCEEDTHTRCNAAQGFCVTQMSRPVPWALFAVSAAYAAPTRLAAALMPALLARVPHVAVLCVGGMPSAATRLALELSGVQDIFCLDHVDAAVSALHEWHCPSSPAQGCVALLHKGELEALARAAAHLSLPLWEEKDAPRVVDATGGELVAFCHPDAAPPTPRQHCHALFGQPVEEGSHAPSASPVHLHPTPAPAPSYVGQPAAQPLSLSAPLRVGTGMEGFWLHPALTPHFFRIRSTRMTAYTGEDAWERT